VASDDLAARKNRAWREVAAIDAALADARIDEAGWFAAMQALITPAYLAAGTPRGQSGHSGDPARWRAARELVCDALDRDGSFLDVGCANGHLMESVRGWAAERGHAIEPFGLDIAPELAALARRRLPRWRDRIWLGNALDWCPPRAFTLVRTGLDCVPPARRGDMLRHLLAEAVEHRLIVGPATEEVDGGEILPALAALGFSSPGIAERAYDDPRLVRRVAWVDQPG
jgi:SAM-dependent methyltransferase